MGSSLLVGGEYVLYAVTGVVELVKEVDDLTSGVAEYSVAALFDEGLNDDFCT